ncbi:MAG: YlxR family protein [Actinomycetota bacterium]|nr:YlxR family protein [Actinomycetota bacterium]
MACGHSEPKGELLRFVRLSAGALQADVDGRRLGRGAYLCAREDCAESALAGPAAFARSFRAPVTIPPEAIQSVSRWRKSAFTR